MGKKIVAAQPDRAPDGEFTSMQHWIDNATRLIGGTNPYCADSQNRRCTCGGDFKRAEIEGTYPIRFWYGAGGQTQKEQRKSQAAARRTTKLQKFNFLLQGDRN